MHPGDLRAGREGFPEAKQYVMNRRGTDRERVRRLFGWIGSLCLLLIIPVKAIRVFDEAVPDSMLLGILPSILGPAGLLFLMLSSSGKLSRLTLAQTALLTALIAISLEFIQLIPRPGLFAMVHYTFDWFDIIASLASVSLGYFVGAILLNRQRP